MGAVLLGLLYLATAAAPALAVRGLRLGARPGGRRGVSPAAAIALALLPLAYVWEGFLPGRALTPTPILAGVAPWADPELTARVAAGAEAVNPLLIDPVAQMIPWRRAASDGLLFDPAQGGGAALFGNGQSALLFPTEAAARLLSPFRAVTYSQAARLLLAAWGMFLLARRLATSEAAALAAAAVYLGSGFLQLWRLHPHSLVAAAAPWIVAALLALVRRPGARPAVALAAAGAAGFLGGHPETLLHVLVFALLLALFLALPRLRGAAGTGGRAGWRADRTAGRMFGRVAAWGASSALLAALLAAPALLPFVENLAVSAEWQLRRDERRQQFEVPLPAAAERLAPAAALLVHGDPRRDTWTGPENLAELGGGALGAGALLLAPLALSGRRRRLAAALLALGVAGLLVAAHVPGISAPFGWLPLLRDSLLKRLTLWWALGAALAAALAVERLRRAGSGRGAGMGGWLLGAGGGAALLVLGVGLVYLGPETPRLLGWELGALAAAAAGAALLAAGPARSTASEPAVEEAGPGDPRWTAPAAAVAAAGRRGIAHRRRRLAGWLLLAAALVVPRAALFDGWVPAASADSFYPETLAIRHVRERLAALGPSGWRVAGLDAALAPHSAAFFGLEEARAYDPMTLAALARFHSALGEVPRTGWVRLLDPARPGLALLGVRFVFDHPSMTHRPGVEVSYLGADAIVYENPRALPRLFVPAEIEVHGDAESALAAVVALDDFAARAVAAGRVLDLEIAAGGAAVRRPNGRAEVLDLEVGRGRVRAVVEAAEPALVASGQPAIPGWRLAVGGRDVEPVIVDGAFLGLEVPAGRHAVELVYAPSSWRLGLWSAGAGAVLAAALLLGAMRGRRPRGAARRRERSRLRRTR